MARLDRLENVVRIQNQNVENEVEEPIANLETIPNNIQRQDGDDEDIETEITSGDQIQLESYKSNVLTNFKRPITLLLLSRD